MVRLLPGLLLVALPLLTGCGHFRHYNPEDPNPIRPSDYVSDESKSCVYIFLIDPIDPLAGSLTGVRDFAHQLGFGKTFQGHSIQVGYFADKIRDIHACCGKNARFVIIGYDTGAEGARLLTHLIASEEIPIAATLYLRPRGSGNWEEDPAALGTIVVQPAGSIWKVAGRDEVLRQPETMEAIEKRLSEVGLTVPPPRRPEAPKVLLVPAIPAPRDTVPEPKPLPPEWQFLRVRKPGEPPAPIPAQPTETLPLPRPLPELPRPSPEK